MPVAEKKTNPPTTNLRFFQHIMRADFAQDKKVSVRFEGEPVVIIDITFPNAVRASDRMEVQGRVIRIGEQEFELLVDLVLCGSGQPGVILFERLKDPQLFSHLTASDAFLNSLYSPFFFAASAFFSPACHSSDQK